MYNCTSYTSKRAIHATITAHQVHTLITISLYIVDTLLVTRTSHRT